MDLRERTAVVTGATSGLGQAAAIAFARDGVRVFVVGRGPELARAVVEQARTCGGKAESVVGDLSTRAGVHGVAAAIRSLTPRIDVLINNAGAIFKTLTTTDDGVEMTFALNALGAYLLERELHPLLATARGRVVNVATGYLNHFALKIDELAMPHRYPGAIEQYGRTKLAVVMMTVEQSKRFEAEGVTAVSLHPGIILGTRFGGGQSRLFQVTAGVLLRAIGMACTIAESVEGYRIAGFGDVPNGAYLVKGVPTPLPRLASDPVIRANLMALLDRLVERER